MISIVVPVFNVENYLERCVQSILKQTYSDFELILVDDGSPDRCPQLCEEFASQDKRIVVIHKENGGLSDARNAGMKVARGEYIGFVDSDDWIAPEMFEKLLLAMQKENADIAACSVEMIWEDGSPSKLLTIKNNLILDQIQSQKALLLEKDLKQPVWYKLYKKETISNVPFEFGKTHEDVYWSYQVFANASRVVLIDYIGYYYYQRNSSIMGISYSMKRLDVLEAYLMRAEFLQTHYPQLASIVRINYRSSCIYHGQMCMKYLDKTEKKHAMDIIKNKLTQVSLKREDYKNIKLSHRVWISLSNISLSFTCFLKNILKVGL